MLGWNVADPTLPQSRANIACQEAWERLHPQATLQLEPTPFESFVEVVTRRFAAGRLADTLELQPGTAQAAVFPLLEPLRRGDVESLDALSMSYATTLSPETPDVYAGVPVGITGAVFYYSKALFERAGLDAERTPATWEELGEVVARLQAAGVVPIAYSGDVTAFIPWCALLAQVFSAGDLTAFRRGEIPLTDERFRLTLLALVDAARDGWFDPRFADRPYGRAAAEFAGGRAAMMCGWIAGGLNWVDWDEQLGKDAYGVFVAPRLPGVKQAIQFARPNQMVGVNRRSGNPEGARSWVEYLASSPGLELGLRIGGAMPNRPGIDVRTATGSPGAAAIADLLERLPTADAPIDFLSSDASATMFATLGATIRSGEVDAFLARLERENRRQAAPVG